MECCVSTRWKEVRSGRIIWRITNEGNYWDHNVEGDAVEGAVVCVGREEVLLALNEMRTERTPEPSEVSSELIAASGEVGMQVMIEICLKILDGFQMPVEWPLGIVVTIFKGENYISNCAAMELCGLLSIE